MNPATSIDRRSTRWDDHREQRRAELIDVARKLIHSDGPDVTMAAIAAASGTSKSIVYRYFQDKDELKQALGESILTRMTNKLEEGVRAGSTPEESIRTMVRMYVDSAASSVNVYHFVIQPSDGLSQFLEDCAALVAQSMEGILTGDRLHAWSVGTIGFVNATFQWWMDSDHSISKDQITTFIVSALLSGVLNDDNATPSALRGTL
ncbi:TetR/AcrR family transcriptional regulator [Flaviflexus equikiangi]|uniref:TetR/AcrR family transcriptional regulator n=1 Tax=Flaviflexus equikiangi TaxID=2758573 RepID=A0ABS2TC55_9ACTO|nr:TetR/AcrR family transcriptional regulator [Flaviflexus equikiangi]MBM9432230.1 TetR/AcrR family transcriptional regulator [Flaviflexus equikiangi]